MIKQIVEISEQAAHLRVRQKQLEIVRDSEIAGSIPCEDLGVLIVDNPGCSYTHQALTTLASFGCIVLLCDQSHLPTSTVLPMADHSSVVTRMKLQLDVTAPTHKRLWKQLVQEKILRQADNLSDTNEIARLKRFAEEVKSGDPTNREAQAAKRYWQQWLSDSSEAVQFKRERYGCAPNNLLNYGYAIIRAALSRAIVAAGLNPALGIKHSHRANAFCLADDLIEPLRPLVDAHARELYEGGHEEIDRYSKTRLLELLSSPFQFAEQSTPFLVGLNRYVASYVKCLEGSERFLEIPKPCTLADIETCGSS